MVWMVHEQDYLLTHALYVTSIFQTSLSQYPFHPITACQAPLKPMACKLFLNCSGSTVTQLSIHCSTDVTTYCYPFNLSTNARPSSPLIRSPLLIFISSVYSLGEPPQIRSPESSDHICCWAPSWWGSKNQNHALNLNSNLLLNLSFVFILNGLSWLIFLLLCYIQTDSISPWEKLQC